MTYAAASFEGRGPHNLLVGTLIELGVIGLVLLALFLLPLLLRRGSGPDAAVVRAMLASLCTLALFLDIFSNRKQVWLVIGLAAGLAYLRQRSERALASGARPQSSEGVGHPEENPIPIRSELPDPLTVGRDRRCLDRSCVPLGRRTSSGCLLPNPSICAGTSRPRCDRGMPNSLGDRGPSPGCDLDGATMLRLPSEPGKMGYSSSAPVIRGCQANRGGPIPIGSSPRPRGARVGRGVQRA